MTAAKLAHVIEQLGGKHIASVRIQTLSGERFEAMQMRTRAPILERVLMDDGGPVVARSFDLILDGAPVTIEHRRPATLAELRSAV